MTAKTEVKDAGRHPFYAWAEEVLGTPAVPVWNFHKILIGPDGAAIAAFGPRTDPLDPEITSAVSATI
jgi:glutathione peroxidase